MEKAHEEHVAHVRDAGGVPVGEVRIETLLAVEEAAHVGDSRDVPVGHGPVRRGGGSRVTFERVDRRGGEGDGGGGDGEGGDGEGEGGGDGGRHSSPLPITPILQSLDCAIQPILQFRSIALAAVMPGWYTYTRKPVAVIAYRDDPPVAVQRLLEPARPLEMIGGLVKPHPEMSTSR
eukprot:scaffold19385_cov63-Phaeocystis_antarctica.AAC.1